MRQRRSGLIIHISSTLGRVLPGSGGLYPATKWALEGLGESLGYEVKAFGIEGGFLEPGGFPTPPHFQSRRAAGRRGGRGLRGGDSGRQAPTHRAGARLPPA